MFYFTDVDYKVMDKNNWTPAFVEETLLDYCSEYELSFFEIESIFNMFGVNELFDGIPMACEVHAKML